MQIEYLVTIETSIDSFAKHQQNFKSFPLSITKLTV